MNENYDYSRFCNGDSIEWKIVNFLLNNESKYAQNLWKMLAYSTSDCLLRDNLTLKQKKDLIFFNNGQANEKRVFIMPFNDDAWASECAILNLYMQSIIPRDRMNMVTNINFDIACHNKVAIIAGEGDIENPETNPNDMDDDNNTIVLYKNRASVMVKCILGALSGQYFDGRGEFLFDQSVSKDCKCVCNLWNRKSYSGYTLTMATIFTGISESSDIGW